MRYPARSFPAARFSSLLAAAIMVAAAYGPAAHAIEPCAPEPNFKAAQGHWYYQVDRATKRKCWFLGQPGSKIRVSAKPQPAPKPRPSSADAPKRQKTASTGSARPDEPIAQVQHPADVSQPGGAVAAPLPAVDADEPLQASLVAETASAEAALSASEPEVRQSSTSMAVEPGHLVALLAAALGLAAFAARVILNHSVLFSA